MIFNYHPNRVQGMRGALCSRYQQALGQRFEIESAVESVGKGAKVLLSVFSKTKAVVTATQTGFEVSQHGGIALQLRHILGLMLGHDGAFMGATCLRHSAEASQAIRVDGATGGKIFTGPLRYGFELEARHRVELDAQRVVFIAERDSRYKGNLVFRVAPNLAATALATQISIINLDFATERVTGFTLGHGLYQFVVYQPGRWVAHFQLTFERESRQARLGLGDEVNRQKPCCQRQFGKMKNGTCDQRRFMPTGIARKDLVATGTQDAVFCTNAVRTAKTIGSSSIHQRNRVKRFGAKKLEELLYRLAGLKLNTIHRHDATLKN